MEGQSTPQASPGVPAGGRLRPARKSEIFFPGGQSDLADAVYVASFPKIVYFWPTMLTFLVCGLLARFSDVSAHTLAWWGIGVFSVNLLIIVQDFDQKKFIILMLILVVVILGAWIFNLKGIPFVGKIAGFLRGLDVQISAAAYLTMGTIVLIFQIWGLFRPLFDYWKLEPNEFVHYIQPFGRDMSVPRMGHTVNKEIPDILEFLLTFGGGTLVIRNDERVVARIPDIPMLGRRMDKIERLLGVTRVHQVSH